MKIYRRMWLRNAEAMLISWIVIGYTDALGAILSNHVNEPRAYIGCMKSGGVFSKSWVS